MTRISPASLQRIVLIALLASLSACNDDRPVPLSEVDRLDVAIEVDESAVENENIDSPTLKLFDNTQVSMGGAMNLVFSDEFDGDRVDPETWFFETGDGSQYGLVGWGNNELQWYLPNSAQVSDGTLKITVRRQSINGYNYTSARINTRDRVAVRYGRVEARMKLPAGQGIWPAFWLLGQDSPYGDWAASGEIDVMEAVNLDGTGGNEIFGTIHFGGEFPSNLSTSETYTPSTDVSEEFHIYAVEWDETEIRWYVDDVLYATQNAWSSTAAPFPAPFDQPFYILLNVAVGGSFPGPPTIDTVFPVTMEVDYVRVYSGDS